MNARDNARRALGCGAALAASLLLAACGGSDSAPAQPPFEPAPAASAPTEPAPEPPAEPVPSESADPTLAEPTPAEPAPAPTEPAESQPAPAEPAPAPPEPAEPEVAGATIRIVGGEPQGGVKTVKVKSGEPVRLRFRSDAPAEVHVHGYEIEKAIEPGTPLLIEFTADIEGVWEIEIHPQTLVAKLEVSP